MSHDDHPGEVELVDEFADDRRVLDRRVAVVGWALREPESRVVDRDAPEAVAELEDRKGDSSADGVNSMIASLS